MQANSIDFGITIHMQFDHEGFEITMSISEFQTLSNDKGIAQRKRRHRISYRLDTADD